jgi:protein SCO1/2
MPDLVLTDTQGEPYHLAESTRGKVALVFFGYTSCPDICPVHLANIAAVLHKLPDEVRREVEVIFITTDPARDSLPRLREWVRQFDRGFVGLTGPDSLIAAAERALGVFPAVVDSANSRGYLVQHAGQVIAFTRDGMARVQYPFGTRQRDWARDLPKLLAADE